MSANFELNVLDEAGVVVARVTPADEGGILIYGDEQKAREVVAAMAKGCLKEG